MAVGMGCDTGRVTNPLFLDCKPFSYKIVWTLSANLSSGLLKTVTQTKCKICWDDFFFF